MTSHQAEIDVFRANDQISLGAIDYDVRDWAELQHACAFLSREIGDLAGIQLRDERILKTEKLPLFQPGDQIRIFEWQYQIRINISLREASELLEILSTINELKIGIDQPFRLGMTPEGFPIGGVIIILISNQLGIDLALQAILNTCQDGSQIELSSDQTYKIVLTDKSLTLYSNNF